MMTMQVLADTLGRLLDTPIVAMLVGGLVGIVAIVAGTAKRIAVSRSREQTKREIAAYVAEGTIDPDKAVEMLKAGERADSGGCCA